MSSTDRLNYTTATTVNTTASTTAMAVVVDNLEDICGQVDQVYLCLWQVVPPSGQLESYFILASSLTWASMPLKASKPPNNQVSSPQLNVSDP